MRSKDRIALEDARCLLDGESLEVANLSLGGFFVATEKPLISGQVLALRLQVAGRDIALFGKVAWVNEKDAPRRPGLPPGFGVAITRIELPDKVALVEILRRHARRPPARNGPGGTAAPRS
jgi:Tfp pilus assembly protein PilZ